jgi:hypothetical protein
MKSPELDIIEAIMECAGENKSCGYEVMLLFLKNMGHDIHMAEEIVKGVLKSSFTQEQILSLLTDAQNRGIWIDTQKLVPIAARYGMKHHAMAALFDMTKNEIFITEELLKEAAKNRLYAADIMKWLLEEKGNELHVTEDVLIESVKSLNTYLRNDVLDILLEAMGDGYQLSEEVLKAVVRNQRHGWDMMVSLIRREGDKIKITEEVLIEAAGQSDSFVLTDLIRYFGDKVEVTENVLKAVLRVEDEYFMTLATVSIFKGKEVRITAEIQEIMSEEQLDCWNRPENYLS